MQVSDILKRYEPLLSNILDILHDLQDAKDKKYLEKEELHEVAKYLNVKRARVMGIATFYSMYSIHSRGKYIIRFCISPHCSVKKSRDTFHFLSEILNTAEGETTADGIFTLEKSECLGICVGAPVMMINDEVFGNLDKDKIKNIIKEYQNGVKK